MVRWWVVRRFLSLLVFCSCLELLFGSPWICEGILETKVPWIPPPQSPLCLQLGVSDPFRSQGPLLTGFFGDAEDLLVLVSKQEEIKFLICSAALAHFAGLAVCLH